MASLEDALSNEPYDLLLAKDGTEACRLLEEHDVDLVVTDIRMPNMDGPALIAEISRQPRPVSCIVMTAFGTPELEAALDRLGIVDLIDKPLEVGELRQRILAGLEQSAGDSLVRGVSVASFLQLLAMERKTCTVRVKRGDAAGLLFFREGKLLDASWLDTNGLDAALELVTWENAELTVKDHCKIRRKRISLGLEGLLLEAMRLSDERKNGAAGPPEVPEGAASPSHQQARSGHMALDAYLEEFKDINGYLASGIMDFTGETLITNSVAGDIDLEATGAVFNDIFRNAHEASNKIGLEACRKMTITTPKGLVVMECSGIDAASHLHFIVVLAADGNHALARKTLEKVVPKVVAEMS